MKIVGVLALFIGVSTVFLGALFKIQSWEMPQIGGMYVDLLTIGMVLNIFGAGLLLLRTILPEPAIADRLELDETRIPRTDPQARPLDNTHDDDLIV